MSPADYGYVRIVDPSTQTVTTLECTAAPGDPPLEPTSTRPGAPAWPRRGSLAIDLDGGLWVANKTGLFHIAAAHTGLAPGLHAWSPEAPNEACASMNRKD